MAAGGKVSWWRGRGRGRGGASRILGGREGLGLLEEEGSYLGDSLDLLSIDR